MLTKVELKKLFELHGFRPLKRLGENYLIDRNIKDKIIKAAAPAAGDTVLEIGPGFGALTLDLAGPGASVYAVEKDKLACAIFSEMSNHAPANLKLICGDILKFDINSLSRGKKIKVVGNLPYYITTPVIERLIGNKGSIGMILILVQKEVARRMRAGPGSKEYGSLSCFIAYHTKAEYIHTVRRTSFFPAPEVDSSLIKLEIPGRPRVNVKDEALFSKIVRGSFNQRRKSMVNSLARKEVLDMPKQDLVRILERAGVEPAARPEDLAIEEFARISNEADIWGTDDHR